MTVSATTVTQYYTGIFRQAPNSAVSAGYQAMANDSAALNSMLSAANLQVDPVIRLYQTAFNRLPDNAGLTAWVVPFSTGAITLQSIANGFTQSTEFTSLYPTSLSNAQYVGALYWNILQRQGEDAGIKGWVSALDSGALTRAQVLLGFSESGEFTAKIEPNVNVFLSNIANTAVADQGKSSLYSGNLFDVGGGSTPGQTFTLTTNVDTFTANQPNAVFTGDQATTQQADKITGVSGTNTFQVYGFQGATAGSAGVTETNTVTFQDVQVGKYVNVGGLILTVANATVVAADIAKAAAGETVTNVTKSGALTGWTASAIDGAKVTFQSSTPNTNVAPITIISTATTSAAITATTDGAAPTAATNQSVLPTMSGIQTLALMDSVNNANLDFSSATKAATGVTTIKVADASALNGKSITTTTGQTLSLGTGNANSATAGTVTWTGPAADTGLYLTFTGYQGGTGVTAQALTITAAAATTLNINSVGAANKISTLTVGASTTKVVVTGDKNLTVTTNLVSSTSATTLKTVDATAATGNLSIALAAATNAAFAFTGGTGNDSVKFADNGLAALTSGAQLDGGAGTNKLGLVDTTISAAEYTAINQAKNFQTVGLNAAVTVDATQFTTIKDFSLDTSADQVITGMKTGATLTVAASHADLITTTGDVGVNDLKIVIGSATSTGLTVGTGTTDKTTIGQTSVSLVSNGDGTGTNTIAELAVSNNSTYTITGSNNLTITAIAAATSVGSKYDASGLTGKLNITGNASTLDLTKPLGDIIIGGSAADTIKVGANAGTVTGNAGNDTFNVTLAVSDGTATPVTKITDLTKGDIIQFSDATNLLKVDLSAQAAGKTDAQIIAILAAAGNADGQIVWGNYNSSTYIFNETATTGAINANDIAVKLTGVLDLTNSTFASNALTFA